MTVPLAGAHVVDRRRFAATAAWRALPAGMRRRWWLFRPLDLLARHWPLWKPRKGLLVVRMDGIGDMVLFRDCLDSYAAAFGIESSDITVLGCSSWRDIAEAVFAGYRLRIIDEHAFAKRPLYRFRIALWVRRLAPAVTVCDAYFRRALMADSLVWLSSAPRQVVSLPYVSQRTRAEYKHYLSQVDEIIDTGLYPDHEVIRHFRFLSLAGGRELRPRAPRLQWPDNAPPVDPGAPYVVLNPGSNEPGRRWPMDRYLSLARRILERGLRVVFMGTKGDGQKALSGQAGVIDLVGRTGLPQLLDLMKGAAAVVGNDSGPAHLGLALGTPSVVIVGGGHFGCFFPYPPEVAPANARFLFQEMECYHCFWRCHKRTSDDQVFPCVGAVGEDEVWRALEELLGEAVIDRA